MYSNAKHAQMTDAQMIQIMFEIVSLNALSIKISNDSLMHDLDRTFLVWIVKAIEMKK